MKFKTLYLIIIGIILFNSACQKDDDEVKINVKLNFKTIPDVTTSTLAPNTPLTLIFNQKIEYLLNDKSSNKFYKFIIDSVFFKSTQGYKIPVERILSESKDTLILIPSYDFNQQETYSLYFYYKVSLKDEYTNKYEIYVKNGVPQIYTLTKEFAVTDYPYFDPNFTAIQYPDNGSSTIILRPPYFTLSHSIDKIYTYKPLKVNYRICIDSAGIYNQQNQSIPSTFCLTDSMNILRIIPDQFLNPDNNYKTSIKYHIELKKGNLDEYQILKKDGANHFERFHNTFNVENATLSIDTSEVEYAYPWPYQYHFLKNETTRGVLKLKNSTKQNFKAKGLSFIVRYTSTFGEAFDVKATYDPSNLKFIFPIPSSNLFNQKIYKIEFISIDAQKNLNVFLSYHFRTSMFNTFEEKINSIYNSVDASLTLTGSRTSEILLKHFYLKEGFDQIEGRAYNGFIRFDAYRDPTSAWIYQMFLYYDLFTKTSIDKNFRPNNPVKIPPTNAIFFNSTNLSPFLNKDQINFGIAEDYSNNFQRLEFYLFDVYLSDYYKISQLTWDISNPNEYDIQIRRPRIGLYGGHTAYKFHIYYYAGDVKTYTGNWIIYY